MSQHTPETETLEPWAGAPAYRQAIAEDSAFAGAASACLPLTGRTPEGVRDVRPTLATARRLVLTGSPGAGKSTVLRARVAELARAAGAPDAALPVYVDLALARSGDGIEELVARALAAHGAAEPDSVPLHRVHLFMDNLDRVTDVYLLEGLELLMRAGGRSAPTVVLACRSSDWPLYHTWFDGLPVIELEPLAREAVSARLGEALSPDAAAAARRWLARDPVLGDVARHPIGLEAVLTVVRGDPMDAWRRGRVLDALLSLHLESVAATDRPAHRAALGDIALAGLGRGALFEADTMALGLAVTRDDMVRTGVVMARGPALEFVEPALAHHCAALAVLARAAASPEAVARRLADLPPERGAEVLLAAYALAPDPSGLVAALLADPTAGLDRAALCLTTPIAADPDGPYGGPAVVAALCGRTPAVAAGRLYQLGEVLARAGATSAAETAVWAALDRMGDDAEVDALLERPDVDPSPPVADWVRQYIAERNRGLVLRGVRDPDASLAAFDRADAALHRLTADLAFERGLSAVAAGQVESAAVAFDAAAASEPDRARYLFHHGQLLLSLGRAADAVHQLQRARELMPGRSPIEAALGDAYRARGWVQEALQSFEAARRLAPHVPGYAQAVGELQAELGDLEAASNAMGEAAALGGDVAAWHDALGQVLAERGRWSAALRAFGRAEGLEPGNPVYLRHLGRAQLAAGTAADAVATLRRAVAADPATAGGHADLGLALAVHGDVDAAIEAVQQAVAVDDGWPADHVWLARLLRDSGRLDDALAHALRAVDLAPGSSQAQADLARVHQARGEYREALAAFNRAVDHTPDAGPAVAEPPPPGFEPPRPAPVAGASADGGVMAPHADAAARRPADSRGAAPDAAAEPTRHQDDGPAPATPDAGDLDFRLRAAQLSLDLGRTDDAVAHLTRAAGLVPSDVDVQRRLGQALRLAGDLERALGVWRRIARLVPHDAGVLVELAEVARLLGRLNEARAAIDSALELSADRADAYAVKAEVEAAAGAIDAACDALRRAHALAPDEARYGLRLADLSLSTDAGEARQVLASMASGTAVSARLAGLHVAEGAWGAACDAYAEARASAPDDDVELAVAHATALRHAGRFDEAVELLEATRRRFGPQPALLREMAEAHATLGNVPEALAAFAAAAEAGPPDGASLLRWSRVARRAGAFDDAIESARRAVAHEPGSAEAHAALAEAHRAAGEPEAALAPAAAAARLAPADPGLRLAHARIAADLGRYDEAIAAIEEGIADCPETAALHHALGQVYAARGWHAEAQAAYAHAAMLEPDSPVYLRAQARQLAEADEARAIEVMRAAVAAAPDDAESAFDLGRLLARTGDDEGALVHFQRAVGRVPEEPAYVQALGRCLARLDRPEAGDVLKRALALDPRAAGTHAALGDWHARAGRQAAALDCYIEAVRLAPEDAAAWRRLGDLRLGRQDSAGAIEAFEHAVRIAPRDASAYAALATALERAGRPGDAVRTLETAARVAGDDPSSHRRLGWARLAAGDPSGAIAAFSRATVLRADDAEAWRGLSEASRRQGLVLDAVQQAERAAGLTPDAASWHALAAAHRANHDLSAAAEALSRAQAAAPDDPATAWAQAEVAELAGDVDTARAAYRRACELGLSDPEPLVHYAELAAAHGWDGPTLLSEHVPAMDAAEAAMLRARLAPLENAAPPALAARAARALAVICGRVGDASAAAAAAERAADRDDAPDCLLILAWARLEAGDGTGALESIGLARALGLDDATTHWLAGRAHQLRGDVALAAEAFRRAGDRAPDRPEVHAALGAALAALGQHEGAFDAYARAHAGTGGERWCAEVARTALAAGRAAAAGPMLEACARDHGGRSETLRALAAARRESGDLKGAIAILEAAPLEAAAGMSTLTELGALYAEAGDPGRALAHFQHIAALTGSAADHAAAAEAALDLGDVEAARRAVGQALAADAGQPLARAVRGRLAFVAGDVEAASEDLAWAAAHRPTDARIQRWLGQAAKARGDMAAAQASLERSAQLDDAAVETFMALGEVYLEQGSLDEAIQAFQQSVVSDPEAVDAHLRLGDVCVMAGLTDKALAHFRRAAEIAPADHRPWHSLGRVQLALGALDEAAAALDAALEHKPSQAEIYYDAGMVAKERRDYAHALAMFKQAMRLSPSNPAAYTQFAAVSALHFLDRSAARELANEDTEVRHG